MLYDTKYISNRQDMINGKSYICYLINKTWQVIYLYEDRLEDCDWMQGNILDEEDNFVVIIS